MRKVEPHGHLARTPPYSPPGTPAPWPPGAPAQEGQGAQEFSLFIFAQLRKLGFSKEISPKHHRRTNSE